MKFRLFFSAILMLLLFAGLPNVQLSAQDGVSEGIESVESQSGDQVETPDATVDQTGDQVSVDDPAVDTPDDQVESPSIWDWIKMNVGELILGLFAFVELIVRLTPTSKDDSWFAWLRKIIDAIIPSFKKGGGTFS